MTKDRMQKRRVCALCVAFLAMATTALADPAMEDDPLLVMVMVNRLEIGEDIGEHDTPLAWEADCWLGRDLDKLWIKSEGEYADSRVEETELHVLYSRAVSPYWDVQAGWRGDLRPEPERNWFALGMHGLAPYFFEVDAALFLGESGRTGLRLGLEYELLLTRKLILAPEVELNLYGDNDPATSTGSGLSELAAGLRLRYEIRREFAPYIGVTWWRKYGDSADYARQEDEPAEDRRWVIGIRAWY